jgi:hypothetical protein
LQQQNNKNKNNMKTHYIANDQGRVRCCADNSHETYTWLLRYNYYPSNTYCADEPYIFTFENMIYSSSNPYLPKTEKGTYDSLYGVWCGKNVDMFKAIAALNNQNDKYQYFVLDAELLSPEGSNVYHKGTLLQCKRERWNIDVNEDGSPCELSSHNIPAHKATVTEILNHFLNNGTKTNIHTISL